MARSSVVVALPVDTGRLVASLYPALAVGTVERAPAGGAATGRGTRRVVEDSAGLAARR